MTEFISEKTEKAREGSAMWPCTSESLGVGKERQITVSPLHFIKIHPAKQLLPKHWMAEETTLQTFAHTCDPTLTAVKKKVVPIVNIH